jgi:hypothetical protein
LTEGAVLNDTDGALALAHDDGHSCHRQSFDEAQDKDLLVVIRESAQGTGNVLPRVDLLGRVGYLGLVIAVAVPRWTTGRRRSRRRWSRSGCGRYGTSHASKDTTM